MNSAAYAVNANDSGQVVGQSTHPDGSNHAVLWEIPTAGMVHDLTTSIDLMELPGGVTDSLNSKLADATTAVVAGDTATACGDLNALINYAAAQIGRKLTVDQANSIISTARSIRTELQCP
jgi:probable HAF family extracellular repeat protein